MSDYEVSLVNDSMQEFYVLFRGPAESKLSSPAYYGHADMSETDPELAW